MLYARFGHPLQVHTDNTTYFRSQLMQEAFKRAGIKLTFTPTYNPQSNSVERVHRDLNIMLRVLCHQHAADWEEVLPAALLALRSAVHESTKITSFARASMGGSLPLLWTCCATSLGHPWRPTTTSADWKITIQGPSPSPGAASSPSHPAQFPSLTGMSRMRSAPVRKSGCSPPSPLLTASLPSPTQVLGGLPTNPRAPFAPSTLREAGANSPSPSPSPLIG